MRIADLLVGILCFLRYLLFNLGDMSKHEKIWQQILSGRSDYNIRFSDLVAFLEHRGFIFTKPGVRERITLQPEGSKTKGYQVRQVRSVLIKEQ